MSNRKFWFPDEAGGAEEVEFQDDWIKSRSLELFNQKELNMKGIGPRFVGGERDREMGLWLELDEEII